MVATSDCVEKPKLGNKVSKPLMEKKRRARINQCLDQLKSLLESYYSTSIRKRKLEKADILELTVKHLRSLQKIPNCAASDLSDYQTGFRNCLANFNHYLLMADSLSGSDHWMLSQLSGRLGRSRRRGGAFSTTDSGPEQAESQAASRAEAPSPLPTGDMYRELTTAKSTKLGGAITSPLPRGPPGAKQAALCTAPTRHTLEKGSKNSHFDGNRVANTQQSVWRPW